MAAAVRLGFARLRTEVSAPSTPLRVYLGYGRAAGPAVGAKTYLGYAAVGSAAANQHVRIGYAAVISPSPSAPPFYVRRGGGWGIAVLYARRNAQWTRVTNN